MRFLFLLSCLFYVLWGAHSAEQITFSLAKDQLKFTLPIQSKISIQEKQNQITLTFKEAFQEKQWSKILNPPFDTFLLQSISPNQTQITLTSHQPLSYSYSQNAQGIHFMVWAIPSFSWWRYFAVLTVLLFLVGILLFLRKRQKQINAEYTFKFKEIYLNKGSKIITLENHEKIFTLFSNERGCVLLDSKEIQKD